MERSVNVVKWIAFVVFSLGGVALITLGFLATPAQAQVRYATVPELAMRALPGAATTDPRPAAAKPADTKPADTTTAEAKPVEAKPADAKPVEAKPADAKPVEAKPAETKPADARPSSRPPGPAVTAGGGEGLLNLRASDTAEVYLDGKKLSPGSPILGYKVKAGKHKVRFDCFDSAGNTIPGSAKTVEVAAEAEQDVDFECPAQ